MIKNEDTPLALITGATAGIGFHTARQLAARGASVLITGRDEGRGAAAVNAIASAAGHTRVGFLQADHSTVGGSTGVGAAAARALDRLGLPPQIDVLVNNVGGIFAKRSITADGYEATLAMNFIAPVAVTMSVLPLLQASSAPACLTVTSNLGWLARELPGGLLADIQNTRDYVGIRAYARAKLLTAAWTITLGRRDGPGLAAATVNPGMAWTAMTAALTPEVVPSWRYVYPLVRSIQQRRSPARAARVCAELALAASPAGVAGQYITQRGKPGRYPAVVTDAAVQDQVLAAARDLVRTARTATAASSC